MTTSTVLSPVERVKMPPRHDGKRVNDRWLCAKGHLHPGRGHAIKCQQRTRLECEAKESVVPRPIKWNGLRKAADDLHTKRPSGHWDIMLDTRDGWIIKPPWFWKTLRDADRIVVGHGSREVARLRAEALIRVEEKWPESK